MTWRAISSRPSVASVASGSTRAGQAGAAPLKVQEFVGSVARLEWAKDNGCPWQPRMCAQVALGGRLEVLQWAREHGCEWDAWTCAKAAEGGHLGMLVWAREHGCVWVGVDDDEGEDIMNCCACAAQLGTWRCCSGFGSRIARGMS